MEISMNLRYLVPMVMLSLSALSMAEDWRRLPDDPKYSSYPTYVDRDSVLIAGEIRRAWIKMVFINPMGTSSTASSASYQISLQEYDCAQRGVRNLEIYEYENDRVTSAFVPQTGWLFLPPGIINEGMQVVCSY